MNSDALEMRQYICSIHAYLTTLLIYGQICIILIGRNMNPESFSVYTSAGLITMDQSKHDHRQPDSLISIFQRFCAASHHVFDGSCCQWDVEHAGQYFMRTVDADCSNCIESNNHRLKVCAILYGSFYVRWKCTGFYTTMHRTFTHFNQVVCSDIHAHYSIYFVACLLYACFIKTAGTIRTTGTVRVHMRLDMIRF